MIRPFRLIVGVAVTLLASGCALQDTRYEVSRSALPFADYDESIIDWNFPTTSNQGYLTAPERLQAWRPALGVPWAYGNPLAPSPVQPPVFSPLSDGASPPVAAPNDQAVACDDACAAPATDAGADVSTVTAAGLREPAVTGTR
jgi:hypothetical protein